MNLSFNEATTMNCPDSSLETDLRCCKQAGFRYIELRYDKLEPYLEKHSADELARLLEENRITALSYNAVYIYQELFTDHDDPERLEEVLHRMSLAAKLAPVIGARDVIVVVPLNRGENAQIYKAEWENVKNDCVRILTQLSDYAAQHGLRLCLEPVGNNKSAVRTLSMAKEIVDAVNRDNLGYTLDAYNLFQYNKSNDFSYIEALPAEKIFAVHLNNADDVPLDEISQADRRFCDSGIIDISAFLEAIKRTGYDGMISIETVRPEYWEKPCMEVIKEAYCTSCKAAAKFL